MSGMVVLVCGGRNYHDRRAVWLALDDLQATHGRLTVIQGGCKTGADLFARDWCVNQVSVRMLNEPADWASYGKAAGPIRNQYMLDEHKPDLVLHFPGGPGTADMVRRAKRAGVPTMSPHRVYGVEQAGARP